MYLPDTVFKEIYDAPTLLTYGFNVDEALQPQMEEFLSSYVSENSSVAYTSTKLLKEQLDSVRSMILVIGGLIGCIMAFAGLINFTNMIITNIITRRHEFATMFLLRPNSGCSTDNRQYGSVFVFRRCG